MIAYDKNDSPADLTIDKRDFDILYTVYTQEGPLWKKKIHDKIDTSITLQTVGRRVDRLRDADYLDPCIVSPKNIRRDYIIGFQLTEKGGEEIIEKRRELLEETALQAYGDLFGFEVGDASEGLERGRLIDLITDEYDLADGSVERLNDLDAEELRMFVCILEGKAKMNERFDDEPFRKYSSLVEGDGVFRDLLRKNVIPALEVLDGGGEEVPEQSATM
jgi:hypothetical protein